MQDTLDEIFEKIEKTTDNLHKLLINSNPKNILQYYDSLHNITGYFFVTCLKNSTLQNST
ncbi:hypothetical protein [Chryseobacterium sp. SIMBA_038]|uniref:hypothetical protein n=1 Tax=Chryseobacterium sp. SIMBA_038 TaxID=3085780 RepID=UPI00397B3426